MVLTHQREIPSIRQNRGGGNIGSWTGQIWVVSILNFVIENCVRKRICEFIEESVAL